MASYLQAVAVGLRCGKADIEAPRSMVKLDSAFPRNSGGRSTLFPVKEESTKLEALSGGHFVATHPSPAFEDAYWVCRPSSAFTHATPFAQCSFGYSGTGET